MAKYLRFFNEQRLGIPFSFSLKHEKSSRSTIVARAIGCRFLGKSHRLVNLSLEIDVQPSISLFYDSDRISKLANEGNGSQVSGNKTRRRESAGTSRRRIYIATRFHLPAETLFLVESLVRRDANERECIKPETAL